MKWISFWNKKNQQKVVEASADCDPTASAQQAVSLLWPAQNVEETTPATTTTQKNTVQSLHPPDSQVVVVVVGSQDQKIESSDSNIHNNHKQQILVPSSSSSMPNKKLSWWQHLHNIDQEMGAHHLWWMACILASAAYCVLIVVGLPTQPPAFYHQGFCVTGMTNENENNDTPGPPRCNPLLGNSHEFAWGMDVLFALGALWMGYTKQNKHYNHAAFPRKALGTAACILIHGYLHRFVSWQHCHIEPSWYLDGNHHYGMMLWWFLVHVFVGEDNHLVHASWTTHVAYIAFVTLIFWLNFTMATRYFRNKPLQKFFLSLFLAGMTYVGTLVVPQDGGSISVLFATSQLVVSGTGLLDCQHQHRNKQAHYWKIPASFFASIGVSLLERAGCASFLVRFGGHAVYDLALHTSMLVTLWYQQQQQEE